MADTSVAGFGGKTSGVGGVADVTVAGVDDKVTSAVCWSG